MRLFVASPLPEHVRVAIDGALDPLRSHHAKVRWARPATWHVTLAFVGNVRDAEVGKVEVALADAVLPAPFEAALAALGGFPDLKRPRVVWVGLSVGAFPELAQAVRDALSAKAIPFDPKPFRAHVTVGRALAGSPRGLADTAARWPMPHASWRADRFVLFRSDLQPAGVIHTPLREYPLPG